MSLREQFEAWFVEKHVGDSLMALSRTGLYGGEYCDYAVEMQWQAYQAGRAVNADLLEACEAAKKRFDELGMDWLGPGLDPLEAAIKKARAE